MYSRIEAVQVSRNRVPPIRTCRILNSFFAYSGRVRLCRDHTGRCRTPANATLLSTSARAASSISLTSVHLTTVLAGSLRCLVDQKDSLITNRCKSTASSDHQPQAAEGRGDYVAVPASRVSNYLPVSEKGGDIAYRPTETHRDIRREEQHIFDFTVGRGCARSGGTSMSLRGGWGASSIPTTMLPRSLLQIVPFLLPAALYGAAALGKPAALYKANPGVFTDDNNMVSPTGWMLWE